MDCLGSKWLYRAIKISSDFSPGFAGASGSLGITYVGTLIELNNMGTFFLSATLVAVQ